MTLSDSVKVKVKSFNYTRHSADSLGPQKKQKANITIVNTKAIIRIGSGKEYITNSREPPITQSAVSPFAAGTT